MINGALWTVLVFLGLLLVIFYSAKTLRKGCGVPTAIVFVMFAVWLMKNIYGDDVQRFFDQYREKEAAEEQQQITRKSDEKVDAFIRELAPALRLRVDEVEQRMSNVQQRINKLDTLQKEFPDQKERLEAVRIQWNEVSVTLEAALDGINDKARAAYVDWTLDEIQGRESLEDVSDELMKQADQAMAMMDDLNRSIRAAQSSDPNDELSDLLDR